MSQKFIARQVGISQSSVSKILRANKFHPYHVTLVQDLKEEDFSRRIQFCNFMQHQLELDNNFLFKVLFSDEARFGNNGVVNRHNCHYYSQNNPHWIRTAHFQNVYSINVWAGIIADYVIGPYFFEGNLTGHRYWQFLENDFPRLLPHYHIVLRNYLYETLAKKRFGRGSVNAWPPRSP